MFAVHARYRGRERRRADLVRRSAEALSTLDGVGRFELLGVEDICAVIDSAEAVTDTTMALLSAGDWAIGIGVSPGEAVDPEEIRQLATAAIGRRCRTGVVRVRSRTGDDMGDIAAVFVLLSHVLAKRTTEGREATQLMRGGMNQNEAAAELGISKQAMSQRLAAAGWAAETAGWKLAVTLLRAADTGTPQDPGRHPGIR
ncbi:MarR family transcriptional regulator [Corynebacterium pygosceleis]|uniref:MarR family transcriptional regulator n=1 Tax=Corynebacterium pygosceleis TaxID=2800406 RepID=A0A9Q4GJ53_9CORY|nr:MarR family transcriptional regulator [Corynebacterium pygosceleis]MCK7637026.1 MarR family transcriptional regulator [Corynebacterium pygosceleis]MCK7674500.1 MarR family transcriptional regulator [Corynebacterium pygosceleis]MCL0120202.1 MarR family transcriptional regulator [Corynebacterium pygosceleis]MCX7443746.1 MarR family transcriptional regulator [Corynebacterium pygosceleis]MCX7467779.1 MarR family transcriptional regulator [Corynebacterium pygosceleis]